MLRVVALALLAASTLLAPAAAASKRSEARRYAVALREFEKAERDAITAAAPAYHARRDAVVADGAPHRLFELVALYGYWAAKPLIEAGQPESDRLVRRLRRTSAPSCASGRAPAGGESPSRRARSGSSP